MSNIEINTDDIFNSMVKGEPFLKNRNLIVVGNNNSGKTTFIKTLLKKAKDEQEKRKDNWVYYIDPMNRTIRSNNNATNEEFTDYTPSQILAYRSRAKNCSSRDVFAVSNQNAETATNGAELSYNELCANIDAYNPVFLRFMGIELKKYFNPSENKRNKPRIIFSDNFKLIVNNDPKRELDSLSSSEVAMMRMLMEISYAQRCKCQYVVIDEFDAFFEIRNMVRFLKALIDEYPSLRFIVVIHNVEALIEIENVDVLLVRESKGPDESWVELFDGNEVDRLAQLDRLIHRYSYRRPSMTEEVLKKCIAEFVYKGEISDNSKALVKDISTQDLSVRERVLYEYFLKTLHYES